jgi:hypothetical protein
MTIEKDTTLNFPVWRKNGTREAFLMHVTAVLDAIKKRGHFYNYKKAAKDHKESTKAIDPCLTEPVRRLRSRARRKPRKSRRMPLQRSKTPSQMPIKPRMLLKQMTR